MELYNIRNFTYEEITEINRYVVTQVPHSILPQLFIITDEPIKKIQIFLNVFKIISSARDFVENSETKNKLNIVLGLVKEIYNNLYETYVEYESTELDFIKMKIKKRLINFVKEYNNNINYLCSAFLVFAEKQELTSINDIAGLNLEKPEGEETYSKIIGSPNL